MGKRKNDELISIKEYAKHKTDKVKNFAEDKLGVILKNGEEFLETHHDAVDKAKEQYENTKEKLTSFFEKAKVKIGEELNKPRIKAVKHLKIEEKRNIGEAEIVDAEIIEDFTYQICESGDIAEDYKTTKKILSALSASRSLESRFEARHFFLTGGAGVGKSYQTRKIVSLCTENKLGVVVLGSTGISAVNVGGMTIHKFFCFFICKNMEQLLISDNSKGVKARIRKINNILKNTNLLVIDEISMVSADMMEMIKYRLDNANYKGSILFVGDFFQLPPVIKKEPMEKKNDNLFVFEERVYAFESDAWRKYNPQIVELFGSKRTEEKKLFDVLEKIRKGDLDDKIVNFLENLRKNDMVLDIEPTILFGTNAEADELNNRRLAELDERLWTFAAKETSFDDGFMKTQIDLWLKALIVPIKLELKVGAQIIFVANKDGGYAYYNGEQGVVRYICDEYITIEKSNGYLLNVERHDFPYTIFTEGKQKTIYSVLQFPVKLGYAITIHKSQGMSIRKLVCNIDSLFVKSQFYVALSRAETAKTLYIQYSGSNFDAYLRKNISADAKVKEFYEKNNEL